jgi:DnaJ like chaperone protein
MSIWGKLIGGAAGFALGGPLGALLGGLAGHAFDKMRGRAGEEGSDGAAGTKQIAFTIGVIALGAKMAKADGRVTADEVAAFKEVFRIPPEEMNNVARVFDRARRDAGGYEPYARQIAKLFHDNPAVLEDLLDGLVHIAKADDVIHPNEIAFLSGVAEIFGFSDAEFDRIRASNIGADEADPYRIIGAPHDISDDQLKKRYRALIREHHPDRLIAEGMPAEFVEVANEKLAVINDAYDRIAKQRALN